MAVYLCCLLAAAGGAAAWIAGAGDVLWPGAALIWGGGVELLGYGLVRDLLLLARARPEGAPGAAGQPLRMAAICLESTLGAGAVAVGLALHAAGWTPPVRAPSGLLLLGSAALVAFGHATRDVVLIVARVENHRNILPSWRFAKDRGDASSSDGGDGHDDQTS